MPRAAPPGNPPPAALEYLEAKGIALSATWVDVWREEHVKAFTVAGITEATTLRDTLASLQLAEEAGLPFEGWRRELLDGNEPLQQLSKARQRIIYETNIRQTRASAQWDRIDSQKRALPYLRYTEGTAREHRPEHAQFFGLILPVDHPFWDTHMPINGYGCTCHVIPMTRRRAEAAGVAELDVDALPRRVWQDPQRPGQTLTLPVGVDPGFDYNPGKVDLTAKLIEIRTQRERQLASVAARIAP